MFILIITRSSPAIHLSFSLTIFYECVCGVCVYYTIKRNIIFVYVFICISYVSHMYMYFIYCIIYDYWEGCINKDFCILYISCIFLYVVHIFS